MFFCLSLYYNAQTINKMTLENVCGISIIVGLMSDRCYGFL